MAEQTKFREFDPLKVELRERNLIEASAGTGKTYSIAILVLRLLVENGFSIKEILMVTFTKAAVAELEERIRLFIRLGYRTLRGEEIGDESIKKLVKSAVEIHGTDLVERRLREAVLFLDETSVLTIHSFCQQTLNEFAFETGQLFGAEMLQDTETVVQDQIRKFWRQNVTVIPADLLSPLISEGLSRASIGTVVKDHVAGKRYLGFQESVDYKFCDEDTEGILRDLNDLKIKQSSLRDCLIQYVIEHKQELAAETNTHVKKGLIPLLDDPEAFLDQITSKRDAAYITKVYGDSILNDLDECNAIGEEIRVFIRTVIHKINCLAINLITVGLNQYKKINNQLSFDDLIVNLHSAIKLNGEKLSILLQEKYRAVFIDEFQDTDRMQYEIFSRLFAGKTILFYIGDPKQSIYAWRKADIFTYFKAKNEVEHLYTMNTNYRSSASLIEAMNTFFLPEPDFDTFYFQGAGESINYHPVEAPGSSSKGELYFRNQLQSPITITKLPKQSVVDEQIGLQVLELLSNPEFTLIEKGISRRLKPSDIGILIRKNKEARPIKDQLAKHNIPAVTIGDNKVLESAESTYVLFLLQAMLTVSRASINKALLSPFTGLRDADILNMDEGTAIDLFRSYKEKWQKEGVYSALKKFIADYRVKEYLLKENAESGERIITNLFQLTELLHRVQINKQLSEAELIKWLKRGIEGMVIEGDEYQQRVESDEDAVKIVTIHKSKGLEYNIVVAAKLDFDNVLRDFNSFRDTQSGEYVSAEKFRLDEVQLEELQNQNEQENRRLIYVAVTRAVFKCFIYRNTYFKSTGLARIVEAIEGSSLNQIEIRDSLLESSLSPYSSAAGKTAVKPLRGPVNFHLSRPNWMRMSYSMLRREHEIIPKARIAELSDPYDVFIFSQLQKGAKSGNMLHYIFENMHFSDDFRWSRIVEIAVERYAPNYSDLYSKALPSLLSHVMKARITLSNVSFQLSELIMSNCIHEFEFDFNVNSFKVARLLEINDDTLEIGVKDRDELEGVMNGKIDLFFEHKGKYFVLDWKSNYLGDSLECYNGDSLLLAMNENNYHLQHLIYTVAIKKYLKSRIVDFDYERDFGGVIYLFIRGARQDKESGIFTYKARAEKIELLERILNSEN